MQSVVTPQALHETLQFLLKSDMPAQYKAVLIEVVTQALRDQDAELYRQLAERADRQWQAHETERLRSLLQGRTAKSWQQADELAMQLATQLRYPLQEIRAKAAELGLGAAVDYRLAKARAQSEPE